MKQNQNTTLRPSKIKTLLSLIVCLGFTFFGITELLYGNDTSVLNWLGIILFGAGCIVFIINLLPNATYLRLSEKGFVIRSLFFKKSFIDWNDVQEFKVARIGYQRYAPKKVVFDFKPSYIKTILGRHLAKNIGGHEGALPSNYGKSAKELAKLLNEWKEKYTNVSQS